MRIASLGAFDDVINGTSSTWYSAAELNDILGRADWFALHAYTTNVSGTSPTLTVTIEHSADSQNWSALSTPISTGIANNTSYGGYSLDLADLFARYVRLKITLGGTNPQCRLKLYVTCRALGAAPGGAPGVAVA